MESSRESTSKLDLAQNCDHEIKENFESKSEKKKSSSENLVSWTSALFPSLLILYLSFYSLYKTQRTESIDDAKCYATCRISIAESIPTNVSFPGARIPESTFEAWSRIIERAEKELVIAAYKSSLQGRHVLSDPHDFHFANEGDAIFEQLKEKGNVIKIGMVESFPPKDKGDNEDGNILEDLGLIERRKLEMKRLTRRDGKMHSKFLLADDRHFYLGSANLDWRSLNQKMELGFVVEDCPCLGKDLRSIYDTYWELAVGHSNTQLAKYNSENPLKLSIDGAETQAYIASSPKPLNAAGRTWDLEALIEILDSAKQFAYVHVMDYHPLFVYRKPRELWPTLDDALRRAIARGVHVRILSAAIHHPELGIRFLKALQDLDGINSNGSVQVKIFKVPPPSETEAAVIVRDRRTHNKVVVTGRSRCCWNFELVGPLVSQLASVFERNWDSEYAHPVVDYFEYCIRQRTASYCESVKDPKLFDNRKY
ncbi:unnamed protein product, partial [Mesorhabditis belari]|uniref:PLD phosphodiesterase domain-containing protein n=1 Tax=Mesorhabditis belari TaxID=2138241 RepID=A0AAF3J9Z9_9BILA